MRQDLYTVYLITKNLRTLEFLAFLIKPFLYFCLRKWNMATLALFHLRKQKYQKWIIHRKLRVPMSEREGKLSNPRARRARDAWRKFTEIYGNPRVGAAHTLCIDLLAAAYTVMWGRRTVFFLIILGVLHRANS
jgi:hypothetical protein